MLHMKSNLNFINIKQNTIDLKNIYEFYYRIFGYHIFFITSGHLYLVLV